MNLTFSGSRYVGKAHDQLWLSIVGSNHQLMAGFGEPSASRLAKMQNLVTEQLFVLNLESY